MTAESWITSALGAERVERASTDAARRRLRDALELEPMASASDEHDLRFVAGAYELEVFDLLDQEDSRDQLRTAAAAAFQILRTVTLPTDSILRAEHLVKLGALATIGDRGADFRRVLEQGELPAVPSEAADWATCLWGTLLHTWLLLMRKKGWEDLDGVLASVASLREAQRILEPAYLHTMETERSPAPGWRLIACYHLAKTAELLGTYLTQGSAEGHYDITQQVEAQFDRAISASSKAEDVAFEIFLRLLHTCTGRLIENCIWTVTRAVNSRVTKFVESVLSRGNKRPLFEVLPPQRKTLREAGLLGSSHRSVVVSLPTSSGKTLIAQFRILQALNQFEHEQGWVAYLAPTRALVNQITTRLRRDFQPLNIGVERVSPALEVDGMEANVLTEKSSDVQFRVLVSTPEKLDLMLRAGWEDRIGRPLTLIVVDEAHTLASEGRGIKLELLLATINRECRFAQFLLLTPFIQNGREIARWLDPISHSDIELGFDWAPNDRAIAIARTEEAQGRGNFTLALQTVHTSRNTLTIPEKMTVASGRPLGLTRSEASGSPGKIAAVTADLLARRGSVVVLADQPRNTWGIARLLTKTTNSRPADEGDLAAIRAFLEEEFGSEFPLSELLSFGVGVHHSGLSDDAKALVEWLTERGTIRILVATTTIAQGVNFPVSAVVLASHQYPYGQDMPAEDFWNIAGRAGRVDQGDLGIIALAAQSDVKVRALKIFINRAVVSLNSTLLSMVRFADERGALLDLEKISYQPEWSAFVQYLAHTYRQMGDPQRFATEVEQILRGTLGFQTLRRTAPDKASRLVSGVTRYAARLHGKPLKLVDSTGFSWESVSHTLIRLGEENIRDDVWTADLFTHGRDSVRRMMGILLGVPELRENLEAVTGGPTPDGDTLSRIVCDWVQGRSLPEMAKTYFSDSASDKTDAMTNCCRSIFGRLTQTASWGLAALQALTFGDKFDTLSDEQQRSMRNLPARVYYGVNSDAALALRMMGVPRRAASPLAATLKIPPGESLSALRVRVRLAGVPAWEKALGPHGGTYHRVWSILEGEPN